MSDLMREADGGVVVETPALNVTMMRNGELRIRYTLPSGAVFIVTTGRRIAESPPLQGS